MGPDKLEELLSGWAIDDLERLISEIRQGGNDHSIMSRLYTKRFSKFDRHLIWDSSPTNRLMTVLRGYRSFIETIYRSLCQYRDTRISAAVCMDTDHERNFVRSRLQAWRADPHRQPLIADSMITIIDLINVSIHFRNPKRLTFSESRNFYLIDINADSPLRSVFNSIKASYSQTIFGIPGVIDDSHLNSFLGEVFEKIVPYLDSQALVVNTPVADLFI